MSWQRTCMFKESTSGQFSSGEKANLSCRGCQFLKSIIQLFKSIANLLQFNPLIDFYPVLSCGLAQSLLSFIFFWADMKPLLPAEVSAFFSFPRILISVFSFGPNCSFIGLFNLLLALCMSEVSQLA